MSAKLDRIQDEALKQSLADARGELRAGNYSNVVHRASDAYVELLRRKPEMLKGPMGMRHIMFFPRLGAHLIIESDGSPAVVYDREKFTFAEAVTYWEYAVDSLAREGL
jgi:hypothetical protein